LIPFNKVAGEEATQNKDDDNDVVDHVDHLHWGSGLKECHIWKGVIEHNCELALGFKKRGDAR
jgi:hypothetical protein